MLCHIDWVKSYIRFLRTLFSWFTRSEGIYNPLYCRYMKVVCDSCIIVVFVVLRYMVWTRLSNMRQSVIDMGRQSGLYPQTEYTRKVTRHWIVTMWYSSRFVWVRWVWAWGKDEVVNYVMSIVSIVQMPKKISRQWLRNKGQAHFHQIV